MEIKGVIQNCWDNESVNSFNKVINLAEENNSSKNTKCFFNGVEIKGKKGLWVAMNALIDSEKENEQLKSEQNKIAIDKLEQVKESFLNILDKGLKHGEVTTCCFGDDLCNKIDDLINGLKGDKDE